MRHDHTSSRDELEVGQGHSIRSRDSPWGATEPHNYHLPYATTTTDDRAARSEAELAWNRGARVVVLPTVPFGVNTGQLDLRLAINMNEHASEVLTDIAAAIAGQVCRSC